MKNCSKINTANNSLHKLMMLVFFCVLAFSSTLHHAEENLMWRGALLTISCNYYNPLSEFGEDGNNIHRALRKEVFIAPWTKKKEMCAIITMKWKLSHLAKKTKKKPKHHPFDFFLSVHDVFIARNDCYYELYILSQYLLVCQETEWFNVSNFCVRLLLMSRVCRHNTVYTL